LLNVWDSKQVFFVIRHKDNLKFETIKELELPENRHQNILKDEIITLTNSNSKQLYPNKLRRVAVWDQENEQVIELITNQFTWTANTISELYKSRWMVEIFFRDLKQLLHIKSFIGTSENAVMIQIWTALITILILKALRAQSQFGWHLSNLVAFIRLNLFVKIELQKWLDNPINEVEKPPPKLIQGVLF
ncbi:IS4 family transposase, partial [Myroides odoratimimus]